jgi:hypothetical protein
MPAASLAGTTTCWNPPTTNTDGSLIPASGAGSLSAFRVEWGTCAGTGFGTKVSEVSVAMPATCVDVGTLTPGCYAFRVYARNTYGSESLPSLVAQKTITNPVPNPPTTVTVAVVAYDYQIKGGRLALGRAVGTVPLGVGCDALALTSGGKAYHYVNSTYVTLTRTPRNGILAQCAAA